MDYPVAVYYVDLHNMFLECVPPHWHGEMEIDLIRSGSAVFSVGEQEATLSAGDVIWINSEHLHSVHPASGDDCVMLSILFNPSYLFEQADSFLTTKYYLPLIENRQLGFAVIPASDPSSAKSLDAVDSIFAANLNKEYGYELETKSLLSTFWLRLLEFGASGAGDAGPKALTDEERVKSAIHFIHNEYMRELKLDDIAGSIHVSNSECCRCFKRSTSLTPFEYLLKYRIFEAARRLQKNDPTAASMQKLSDTVGFNTPSYFNRIFKKYLDATPGEYRDRIRASHRDALNPYGISIARL
ncbi:MAG: AraC family transcriptional regulator [Lachnospiraceae bacterium]|nr:AraC family transcriptional regulator [Lachnospiraceae bacterium]